MSEKQKPTPSFKNQELGAVKPQTDKMNHLMSKLPTNNITKLNNLI